MVGIRHENDNTREESVSTRLPVRPDEEYVRSLEAPGIFFPVDAPIEIEFGSGKGRFLIESAGLDPARNFLGIERSLSYYRIGRDRLARAGAPNARIIRGDAADLAGSLPRAGIRGFHAYFLDPWPKKRQQKRRLLTASFFALLWRAASPDALLRAVTDHEGYAGDIARALDDAGPGLWTAIPWESAPNPPPTHFELKYRAAGRPLYRFLRARGSGEAPAGIVSSETTSRQKRRK
jgi:tRNA (guanine-N7-)-methyltransferase